MDGTASGLMALDVAPRAPDFALIAHQESWRAAADVMQVLRGPGHAPIPLDELQEIFPWIPPRVVCHVEHRSVQGHSVHGVYIDCFIPPGKLGPAYREENIARVRDAARCAIRLGAKVVALGGFSSILIEGDAGLLPEGGGTAFTTGNTLTVAYIVEGIQRMCELQGRTLGKARLLIVGATGDVGSGCARCLGPLVRGVILNARNVARLEALGAELEAGGVEVELATELAEVRTRADVVICVASLESPTLLLGRLAAGAIVCDAGYPKNLAPVAGRSDCVVFYGGLAQSEGGMRFVPDVHRVLQRHPFPNVGQGCLMEGMVLAMEGRFEAFSQGRGNITSARVAEIHSMATRHGLRLAPFYNAAGPIDEASLKLYAGVRG